MDLYKKVMKLHSTYEMEIKLKQIATEAFDAISEFSHFEIIYFFDKAEPGEIVFSGRPRGNPDMKASSLLA